MAKRFFSITGIAVIVLIVLAACGSPQEDEPHATVTRIASPINAPVISPTPEEGAEPTEAPTEDAGGDNGGSTAEATDEAAGGAQEITVVAHDIYFEPAELSATAGAVTFILPNEGAAQHNFVIDALDILVDMPPGATQTLDVDIPAGTYEYYCSIPGHKDAGMVGTLVVE